MKILLIGDSIRQGYDKYVEAAFEGVAKVYYPHENCKFTAYILRQILDWKEKLECGDDVDLVHWNAGIWDTLVLSDGKHHTPLDIYKENVSRICDIIKILFPKAKMVFATSTPCNEEFFKTYKYKRTNSDTECYNKAAAEIVLKNGGSINDLYGLLKDEHMKHHSDQTHFYTKSGTKIITEKVVNCIENELGIKGKNLDFDTLFAQKDDAIGL